MAYDATLLINVITDAIAILILAYIPFSLARADTKYVKQNVLLQYEAMKRDKVFRKSLVILTFSLMLSLAAALMSINDMPNRMLINGAQILSNLFRIAFFAYLLLSLRSTMR